MTTQEALATQNPAEKSDEITSKILLQSLGLPMKRGEMKEHFSHLQEDK